jgi:galactokinase
MNDDRLERLRARFAREYGPDVPTLLACAPGRVNLIGEHTDYNGLPVFPMAIQRDIALLIRARDDGRVRLCNLDPSHAPREFAIDDSNAAFAPGDWGNYAQCAALELGRRYRIERGIDAVVHGDIPPAAGLSSSSAMVVACALALLHANEVEIERAELMSMLAEAERFVGTQSGGMDQAISLGGRRGSAAMIEFDPLRLTHVPVPAEWCFVIANSLVRAEKAGAAQRAYNARTVECREALSLVLEDPVLSEMTLWQPPRPDGRRSYADLLRQVPIATLLDVADRVLSDTLRRRFRHVVREGLRVGEACAAMSADDIETFGQRMNASHESLRDDYEVSCPALDRLVDAARRAGASGARLTGAGFGGCIVALCRRNEVELLLEGLRAEIRRSSSALPTDAVLIAEPSEGAYTSSV